MNLAPLVIYHGECTDGFCGAWVMLKALGSKTIFFHALYDKPPPAPEILVGRDVYMVDMSYPREVMRGIASIAQSLTVFDHHTDAIDELAGLEEELLRSWPEMGVRIVFDLERSGAAIAWDEMNPEPPPLIRPWLVDYVEDRDLWRFRLPGSKRVNAYIGTVPHELEAWQKLAETPFSDVLSRGVGAESYIQEYCRCALKDGHLIDFQGHSAIVFNAHGHSRSELLSHALDHREDVEVAILWWLRGDGVYHYSLRSREGGPKVNKLAQIYGGGGHERSAAFVAHRELEFGNGGEEKTAQD